VEHADVPVTGAFCFVDADWPLIGRTFTIRGIQVLWPGRFTELLVKASEATVNVATIRGVLAEIFPPCCLVEHLEAYQHIHNTIRAPRSDRLRRTPFKAPERQRLVATDLRSKPSRKADTGQFPDHHRVRVDRPHKRPARTSPNLH
jgi:hypothetical protein